MIKHLLLATAVCAFSVTANAQCTEWVSPEPGAGWTDFDPAPCNGQSQEMDMFEAFASEAYQMEGITAGGNYTFSICNGPGAGSWVPDFTIIAPSGAVDAFGSDDGSACSITWTASETGTYLIVVSEAENCGVENATGNGYPMIMTNSGGEDCGAPPVFVEGAESFEADSVNLPACWQAIDADGDSFNWTLLVAEELAFEGQTVIASYSYDNATFSALNPDNYLITPLLDIQDGDSLYYVVRTLDPNFPAENYSVMVSTSGTEVADFTDELFTEVLSTDDYQGRSIDLSAYAGQSIYVAFRHHDVSDQFGFVLDAISLPGVVCDETGVKELNTVAAEVFPNPATDHIRVRTALKGAASVTVFDAVGKVISAQNVTLDGSDFVQNVASLENGIYTIQIQTAAQVAVERFVKQ